jgi:hypothetical protein
MVVALVAAGGYWGWERSAVPATGELLSWCEEGRYLEAREGLERVLDRAAADPAAARLYRQLREPLGLWVEFHHQPAARKNLQPEHLALAPAADTVALAPGDLYRFSIAPEDSVYLYVFRRAGTGSVEMLWPTSAIEGAAPLAIGKKHYLPADTQSWFKAAGDQGPEQVFLVAARRRGLDLERFYRRYEGAAGEERGEWARKLREALAGRQTAGQTGLPGVYYAELTLRSVAEIP